MVLMFKASLVFMERLYFQYYCPNIKPFIMSKFLEICEKAASWFIGICLFALISIAIFALLSLVLKSDLAGLIGTLFVILFFVYLFRHYEI